MKNQKADCNACTVRDCKGFVRLSPRGIRLSAPCEKKFCSAYRAPKGRFKLVELALEYPQSLQDALSALPFKVQISKYL